MKKNKGSSVWEIISIIIGIILIGLTFWGVINLLDKAMQKSEATECLNWQKQSTEYPGYYITRWQADQCGRYNITIKAPIHE